MFFGLKSRTARRRRNGFVMSSVVGSACGTSLPTTVVLVHRADRAASVVYRPGCRELLRGGRSYAGLALLRDVCVSFGAVIVAGWSGVTVEVCFFCSRFSGRRVMAMAYSGIKVFAARQKVFSSVGGDLEEFGDALY